MADILVIDDDPQMLVLINHILTRAGHNVTEAANGKIGEELCHKQKFDLAITDILMPVQEGMETIMVFKHNWPHMKIIAVTGGGNTPAGIYLSIADKLGANKLLKKPFHKKELVDAVFELTRMEYV